jgi:hypothetical protein
MSAATVWRPRAAIRAAWDEMAPAFSYHYDAGGMERWDGKGGGPGRYIAFEGFGLSFTLYFGRMPRKAVR